MLEKNKVYVRTSSGSKEMGNVVNSVLPREARNLLILLDGRKTFQEVSDILSSRTMYREAGGVMPYMELLMDLEYVVLKSSVPKEPASVALEPTQHESVSSDKANGKAAQNITIETDDHDRYKDFGDTPDLVGRVDALPVDDTFEKVKSYTAQLLERNLDGSASWSFMMNLERCQSINDIYFLLEKTLPTASGKFEKSIKQLMQSLKRTIHR